MTERSVDKKTQVRSTEEALKLALEALEYISSHYMSLPKIGCMALAAVEEALAEQCVCGEPDTPGTHRTDGPCLAEQPAQQQEPVALSQAVYTVLEGFTLPHDVRKILESAYYSDQPASKPWVGLTEEERNDLEDYCEMIIGKAAFDAIEAKLKAKNSQ